MSRNFSLQYIENATYLAKMYSNEFVTPEHMLMCLLQKSEFGLAIEQFGIDTNILATDLEEYFAENRCISLINKSFVPEYSACLMDVLEILDDFIKQNNKLLTDFKIFEALVLCNSEWIAYCFLKQNTDILEVVAEFRKTYDNSNITIKDSSMQLDDAYDIKCQLAKEFKEVTGMTIDPNSITDLYIGTFNPNESPNLFESRTMDNNEHDYPKFLDTVAENNISKPKLANDTKKNPYITNLSENHSKKAIHYIGRNDKISDCIDILCRLEKNNILITGETGVGKTSFINGIIDACEKMEVADPRYNRVSAFSFIKLNINALKAGAIYKGELSARVSKVIGEIVKTYQSPVIFIDEFGEAFDKTGGDTDIVGALKEYMTMSKLKFIGTCSSNSYLSKIQHDAEITRRFSCITLDEPSIDESIKILSGIKGVYERYHNVKYSKKAIESAVKLSKKFIKDRNLPDKAIDLIDESGVYCLKSNKSTVTSEMIEAVLSKKCKIPVQNITENEISKVRYLNENINNNVFGQDEAVKELVKYIKINKAGLTEDNKPVGTFMFVGPTGVGKTEVARTLAKQLGTELITFDMSEYSEEHTVTKLIGSPPSYVGYEEGSLLVNEIQKHPDCVLLLDEIEKAHPVIYNTLLQIMDNAVLTDSKGIKAHFDNVIIIMTSNCGAAEAQKNGLGFIHSDKSDETMKQVDRTFTPEFRGRLTRVIQFKDIDNDMSRKIIDKFIAVIEDKLRDRQITLNLSEEAYGYIMNTGFNSAKGARGIQQVIDNELKTIISEEIVSGRVKNKSKLNIVFNSENLVCRVS